MSETEDLSCAHSGDVWIAHLSPMEHARPHGLPAPCLGRVKADERGGLSTSARPAVGRHVVDGRDASTHPLRSSAQHWRARRGCHRWIMGKVAGEPG